VFVPRTSSTPVATWFWQTEGRSAKRVILGVRPSEFILSEFQSPSRRIFIGSHSLPPLSGRLISPSPSHPKLRRPTGDGGGAYSCRHLCIMKQQLTIREEAGPTSLGALAPHLAGKEDTPPTNQGPRGLLLYGARLHWR
jgi:hypothetical protein